MSDKNDKAWTLIGRKTEPMTQELSMDFLTLTMMEMRGQDFEPMGKELDSKCFAYQVIKRRLEVFKENYNPALDVGVAPMAFCAMMCENPAQAVMWAYTLNEIWCREKKKVTLGTLAETFPMGFPTKGEMMKAWDEQKVDPKGTSSDNGLDDFGRWHVPVPG